MEHGIYLIVHFNFPKPFRPEHGEKVKTLRQALAGQDWVEEVLAASGGIGGGPASIWIFRLKNYAALDRLFHGDGPVSAAYMDFFSTMDDVRDMVREEIIFSD